MNSRHRLFLVTVTIAIIIKLSLFAFAAVHAPQGKILPDSPTYLRLADTLTSRGAFAEQSDSGALVFETFRTPGYPAFLAIFHGLMRIPLDGIVLIQIAMTLLAAFITYKTAMQIDQRIAFLSAAIILLDPPITIFSLTILTESLFLLLISVFMFYFTLYLKCGTSLVKIQQSEISNRYCEEAVVRRYADEAISLLKMRNLYLIISALALTAAAYVRPVAYYLGFIMPIFIIYAVWRENFWKSLRHALIFIVIVYSIIGLWQVRNYARCHDLAFCGSDQYNLSSVGLFHSYARSTDPYTKGMAPLPYYISVSFRSLMSLMTRPGNFKYFGCETLNLGSFIFSYPWMVFWLSGLIYGVMKMGRNIYLQMMLFVALYFIITSIGGLMWGVSERLRVPIMPFIAIISAYGWLNMPSFYQKYAIKKLDK